MTATRAFRPPQASRCGMPPRLLALQAVDGLAVSTAILMIRNRAELPDPHAGLAAVRSLYDLHFELADTLGQLRFLGWGTAGRGAIPCVFHSTQDAEDCMFCALDEGV